MLYEVITSLNIKTYCSAAPKPGNLFYAYDFEHITEGGWAFNVVNSADWVPELPSTTQTVITSYSIHYTKLYENKGEA